MRDDAEGDCMRFCETCLTNKHGLRFNFCARASKPELYVVLKFALIHFHTYLSRQSVFAGSVVI